MAKEKAINVGWVERKFIDKRGLVNHIYPLDTVVLAEPDGSPPKFYGEYAQPYTELASVKTDAGNVMIAVTAFQARVLWNDAFRQIQHTFRCLVVDEQIFALRIERILPGDTECGWQEPFTFA